MLPLFKWCFSDLTVVPLPVLDEVHFAWNKQWPKSFELARGSSPDLGTLSTWIAFRNINIELCRLWFETAFHLIKLKNASTRVSLIEFNDMKSHQTSHINEKMTGEAPEVRSDKRKPSWALFEHQSASISINQHQSAPISINQHQWAFQSASVTLWNHSVEFDRLG